tara:strand:+ start:82 stop:243 length:162 start_codon:yes stop_codon:yes gene_type:complete
MNRFLLLIIFFLVSCSTSTAHKKFNFSDKMSFEEFRVKLNDYAKNNPYPNIDN